MLPQPSDFTERLLSAFKPAPETLEDLLARLPEPPEPQHACANYVRQQKLTIDTLMTYKHRLQCHLIICYCQKAKIEAWADGLNAVIEEHGRPFWVALYEPAVNGSKPGNLLSSRSHRLQAAIQKKVCWYRFELRGGKELVMASHDLSGKEPPTKGIHLRNEEMRHLTTVLTQWPPIITGKPSPSQWPRLKDPRMGKGSSPTVTLGPAHDDDIQRKIEIHMSKTLGYLVNLNDYSNFPEKSIPEEIQAAYQAALKDILDWYTPSVVDVLA